MSDNSKCGTGCVTGKAVVEKQMPNLVSPSTVVAGKRPCNGKLPFNVPWCRRSKGWPAGSMVYTSCGYFFNTERAYGDPADADSMWIEFDFKFLFGKLLDSMSCGDSCPSIEDGVKPWDSTEGVINLASKGETWCFTVVDGDGNESKVFACAKEDDLIKDPFQKPEAWSTPMTPAQMMCSILNPEELDPTGVASFDDSVDGVTTITLNNGVVLTSPEQDSPDRYLGNPTLNADGTAYIWDVLVDGVKVGEELQAIPPAPEPVVPNTFNDTQFTVGAGGLVSLKPCQPVDLISDECGLLYKPRLVDCGDGNYKMVRVTDAARCIAGASYQGDSKVFPVDTTDHSSFMAYDELASLDLSALSAADQARLDAGAITSVTFNVACEGVYTVGIDGVAIQYGGPSGESTVLPILDGMYLNATTTSPIATQSFTAHETSFSEVEFDVYLTTGSHTFDFYLIGFSDTVNAAQVALISNTSRFKICKADA